MTHVHEDEFELKVTVEDQGVGLTEEEIELIFTPFASLTGNKNVKVKSNFLGLSITKSICEALGGELSVKSSPNLGSKFKLTMRAVQVIPEYDERKQSRRSSSMSNSRIV